MKIFLLLYWDKVWKMFKGFLCVEKEFYFKQKLESCCNDFVQDVYFGEEFDRLLEEVCEVKLDI